MRATNWMMGWSAAALFALVGCGGPITYTIKGTPRAPEVDGTIVAEPNKDHAMTKLNINLEHLAPPDRLGGGAVFVVWAKDESGKWNRVGNLKYDEGKRKALFEGASVPQTTFDLQITVEKAQAADAPSSDPVLAQHIN